MKKMRKLIPALAMLLVSAVMMSTASFAWFSMNTTVTATGMKIKAKSDQTFLIISATNSDPEDIQNEYADKASEANAFTATTTIGETAVYPAAVATAEEDLVDDDSLEFHYAVGTSYTDGTAKGEYKPVTNLSDYVVKHTFYITVTKGAVPAEDIVVKSLTITGGSEAVHVVVTSAYAAKEYTGDLTSEDADTILSGDTEITDSTVLEVYVYVFYDGDYKDIVTTENAASLEGATVEIVFGVKGATA